MTDALLDILYEDDALLFVNKPAGIVVQRGYDADEPVLVEIAAAYAGTIFLMQRLDRGTSGVMFFSKLASINGNLTRQFEGKRIRKRYVALCEGELGERQTIDAPLIRIGPISFGVGDGGRRAMTIVTPIRATRTGSLVAVDLLTGRTHQIRVHMAAIGHPLIGDWLYGQRNATRPMLHAKELSMTHPLTNEPLRVKAPLPQDFLETANDRGIVSRGEDVLTLTEIS
ncbi:MAG: rRNA synthase [Thermoanaerobaculia bacterium]|jgi:23S rRNA pseudouridine1911/1915/1917 synthase|nr:rRNA synthase [Thermoanaerobaculia bacterium]